jgi:hypothetical protein
MNYYYFYHLVLLKHQFIIYEVSPQFNFKQENPEFQCPMIERVQFFKKFHLVPESSMTLKESQGASFLNNFIGTPSN